MAAYGPGGGVGGVLDAGVGGGVLGGGPGKTSPLRELLRLHQVVQHAARDPSVELLAQSAYHDYSFSSTVLIIKALSEKQGDLLALRDFHARQRVDLARVELELQSRIDALPPHQAAGAVAVQKRTNRSRNYHEGRMKFAMHELDKIAFHLEIAYHSLEALCVDPFVDLDGAFQLTAEDDEKMQEAEIQEVKQLAVEMDVLLQQEELIHTKEKLVAEAQAQATLKASTDDKELQETEIHDDKLSREEMLALEMDTETASQAEVKEYSSDEDHLGSSLYP